MEMNINILPYKVKRLVNKQGKVFAEAASEKASELLGKRMDKAIAAYYNNYSPVLYDRTFNLQKHAWKPYLIRSGKVRKGGIKLYTGMEKYKDAGLNTPTIFYKSVWLGQHGSEAIGNKKKFQYDPVIKDYVRDSSDKPVFTIGREEYRPIVTHPKPYFYVLDYLNSKGFQNQVAQYALNQVNKVRL